VDAVSIGEVSVRPERHLPQIVEQLLVGTDASLSKTSLSCP
jgi:hypothetical protein